MTRIVVAMVAVAIVLGADIVRVRAWGAHGHVISARAAAGALPQEMPEFFRAAVDQLAYLNPEPDRWRDRIEADVDPAMLRAFNPDHVIHFERIPDAAWQASDRFAFLAELRKAGMELPEAGLSPFRMVELFQRLRAGFRAWRTAPDARTRTWIEQRIINDAGILGHYVADGANPLHTSIHHHGWVGDNPKGYATDREIHARFESLFVQARLRLGDIQPLVPANARVLTNPRQDILAFLKESHAHLPQLYDIDSAAPFNELTTAPANAAFTAARLAFGASMLRDLWWTAWTTSAAPSSVASAVGPHSAPLERSRTPAPSP